jgi:hypothetical protein
MRCLLSFTAPAAAQAVSGVDTVVTVGYRELVEKWPDPAWLLAIDAGTPIGALVPVDAVVRATLGEISVTAAEPPGPTGPAGPPEPEPPFPTDPTEPDPAHPTEPSYRPLVEAPDAAVMPRFVPANAVEVASR